MLIQSRCYVVTFRIFQFLSEIKLIDFWRGQLCPFWAFLLTLEALYFPTTPAPPIPPGKLPSGASIHFPGHPPKGRLPPVCCPKTPPSPISGSGVCTVDVDGGRGWQQCQGLGLNSGSCDSVEEKWCPPRLCHLAVLCKCLRLLDNCCQVTYLFSLFSYPFLFTELCNPCTRKV